MSKSEAVTPARAKIEDTEGSGFAVMKRFSRCRNGSTIAAILPMVNIA